ncbi:hypothetical protein [Azospirillum sp. sgz301742]
MPRGDYPHLRACHELVRASHAPALAPAINDSLRLAIRNVLLTLPDGTHKCQCRTEWAIWPEPVTLVVNRHNPVRIALAVLVEELREAHIEFDWAAYDQPLPSLSTPIRGLVEGVERFTVTLRPNGEAYMQIPGVI